MDLDIKTAVEVKALEKAMEEIEKNFVTMGCMEIERLSQIQFKFYNWLLKSVKRMFSPFLLTKLQILGWEDLVHCWSILLKQKVDSTYRCAQYIENHFELLDFLVVCKNIQIFAFHIFKVFVATPNKPPEVKVILAKNHEELLEMLSDLSVGKDADDEQFKEEKELIMKEIDRVSRLRNLDC